MVGVFLSSRNTWSSISSVHVPARYLTRTFMIDIIYKFRLQWGGVLSRGRIGRIWALFLDFHSGCDVPPVLVVFWIFLVQLNFQFGPKMGWCILCDLQVSNLWSWNLTFKQGRKIMRKYNNHYCLSTSVVPTKTS